MKKINLGIIGVGALVLCLIGLAWAASPHFQSGPSASIDSEGDLVINFRETGLGNQNTYRVVTDVVANYQCVNKGNNCPQAANKQQVQAHIDQTVTVPIHNGNSSGPIVIPPPPVTDFCPGKQFPELQSITWGATLNADGTLNFEVIKFFDPYGFETDLPHISRTFFVCP